MYRLCYSNTCSAVSGFTDVTWATTVTAKAGVSDTFTFNLSPKTPPFGTGQDVVIGANTIYLVTTLVNYATVAANVETITVTVNAATCDCNKARWTAPASPATQRVNVSQSSPYTFLTLTVVAASVNAANNNPNADSIEMRAC